MTRRSQKDREQFFAEEAARSLGGAWSFDQSSERPDFIVGEAGHRFGLEVTDVFMGSQTSRGSSMKASESKTQKVVSAMQRTYEAAADVPLHVRFVGIMDSGNMAKVLPALLAEDFPSKPLAYQTAIDTGSGLRVHVTKGLRSNWYSVNNRVGFVDRNPKAIIEAAIAKKAQELAVYQKAAGADVRLLLVADRIHNSGKLAADLAEGTINTHGFSAVYFFPYPENVVSLHHAG
jgi:hypothetical protein